MIPRWYNDPATPTGNVRFIEFHHQVQESGVSQVTGGDGTSAKVVGRLDSGVEPDDELVSKVSEPKRGFLYRFCHDRAGRLAGFLPIFVAGVLAATAERPDLLVDEEASAVAVRAADGRYRILRKSGARFVTDVWLRSDGDRRPRSDR